MALDLRSDLPLSAKVVLLVSGIICASLAGDSYHFGLLEERYYVAATIISLFTTLVLFVLTTLTTTGHLQANFNLKRVDAIGHGIAGTLLLIGVVLFSISVGKFWDIYIIPGYDHNYKRAGRALACILGFMNSFLHLVISVVQFRNSSS